MPGRGTYDSYPRMAGMRILQTEGKTLNCPTTTMSQRGWFSFLANSGDWYSDFYDLDFFNSLSGGTGTICVDDMKIGLTLTVASGCPPANSRGSIWVPSGQAWASVWDPTLVPITNSWVSLCVADASNHDVYLRLFPARVTRGPSIRAASCPATIATTTEAGAATRRIREGHGWCSARSSHLHSTAAGAVSTRTWGHPPRRMPPGPMHGLSPAPRTHSDYSR